MTESRKMTMVQAINLALMQEMERAAVEDPSPSVRLLGAVTAAA